MTENDDQRQTSVDFMAVVEYFLDNEPGIFEDCLDEFMAKVSPDPGLDQEEAEILLSLAAEWFAFDYRLPNGLTPMQEFARSDPDGLGTRTLQTFDEAAATHVATDFWLKEIDLDDGWMVLQPLHGDSEYRLRDIQAAQIFGSVGAVGIRIARTGDEWVLPGGLVYFSAVPEVVLEEMVKTGALEEPRDFLDMVKECFGADNQWRPVATEGD